VYLGWALRLLCISAQQVPPLRYAPVGMTIPFGIEKHFQEGSAVLRTSLGNVFRKDQGRVVCVWFSVEEIGLALGLEIMQLRLPVLRYALRVAACQHGFEHAPIGEQGFHLAHLKFLSGEFMDGGRNFQA
jgi:hypothetical protein